MSPRAPCWAASLTVLLLLMRWYCGSVVEVDAFAISASSRSTTTTAPTTTRKAHQRRVTLALSSTTSSTTGSSSRTTTTTTTTTSTNGSNDNRTKGSLADRTRQDFPILSSPAQHQQQQQPPMNGSQSTTTTTTTTSPKSDDTTNHPDVPLIYLDSAATSQKPTHVLHAIQHYYSSQNANVHRGAHSLSRQATTAYEAARDTVAQFIGAPSRNEVIFTSGATDALNLIVQSFGRRNLGPGDEVVLTVSEHHANLVPWQMLAQEKGFTLKFVPLTPDGSAVDWSKLPALLHPVKTKMVSFQHVSNVLATVNPVAELVQLIRQRSPQAKIVLDACQSVPHMPVNVQELGIDFLVASGHKMCGPTGVGFLWGRLPLLNDEMSPYKGGGEMIDSVTLEQSTFLPAPSKFEAGTPPIAQAIGLAAAVDYLQSMVGGMAAVEEYEYELGLYLYQQLSQVPGIRILGPPPPSSSSSSALQSHRAAALAAFVHESIHAGDLSALLDTYGVAVRAGHHCCQPLHQALGVSHSVRASLAFYNTFEEIDLFIQHLKECIAFFEDLTMATGEDGSSNGDGEAFVPFI